MKIGFIGIGVMGSPMVLNLMKKGFDVSVYTRTKSKANQVIDAGAHWCDTIAEVAKNKDAVITIVGYPKDVEEVYFGDAGIIANADKGTVLIDMTTTSPKLSQKIDKEASSKGLFALDAPVSGGDIGAQKGTLAIMVGGEKEIFDKMMPVFEAMGTNIRYQGAAGNGQHTKMANQIAITGCIASVCEAITYARNCGLDPQDMFNAISTGAAGSWQMTNNGQKIIDEDFAPGFFVKHFIKDMGIAIDESDARNLNLKVLHLVYEQYHKLAELNCEDDGTQALIKVIDAKGELQ